MSSLYTIGQMNELADAFEADGFTPDLLKALTSRGRLRQIKALVEGRAQITMIHDAVSHGHPFFRTRKGLWVDNDFLSRVAGKADTSAWVLVSKHVTLMRDMNDDEIGEMLGRDHLFTETDVCALISNLIKKEEAGTESELLKNGYANLFYLRSCVVSVRWFTSGHGWRVRTWDIDYILWNAGDRVFSPAC